MQKTKARFVRNTALLLALLLMFSPILSVTDFGLEAQALTYRTGANGPAATYKASKYYTHATSINLTGDAVTDILSLALSQLGYYEGTSSNPYSGLYNTYDTYTSNKTTEYVYNYGDADSSGYKMAWCASFCSWAIFQAGVTNHSTHAQSCRNHIGDKKYIWRECSCYQWADQLKRFNMYYARGSYTPKAGDLIFFKMDGGSTAWTNHIGLVLYSDGSRVYTVEGNRHNHVGLHNYSLSDSQICGYGVLPYPKKDGVAKVDYTGKSKTAGKYITNNATLAVSATKGGATSFSVGKYEMFDVTGFDGSYAKVTYGGKSGYATLSSTTIQVTASAETVKSMDVTVPATSGKVLGYAGGSKLPDSNNNFQNVNVLVEGLRENTNNYKGLENYGTNKDKIIINGRTLSKWESRADGPVINNVWVYTAGDGKAYLGIDIADTSKLRMKGRDGTGEEIESIVIKRGFEIVSTTSDRWTAGELTAADSNIGSVVGVFKENVVLTAADNTYFNVTLGGSNSLGLDGLTFQTANAQAVKITAGVNIRLDHNSSAYAIAFGNPGDTYEYLGEMWNNWYKVDCKGYVCWINGDAATLVDAPRTVTLTADANIRSGADTTYSILGVGLAGETFEYLNETQNTKWLKVNYNGQTGWVSNVNATLSAQKTIVNVTAANKDWDGTTITPTPTPTPTPTTIPSAANAPRLSTPMVGIDVSSWNQEIDWAKVKAAGVDFAIIRMFHHIANTPNYELDEQFVRNVTEAQKYGIDLGVYFFSYAQTLDAITTEANMVVNELKKYPGVFSFPVIFDAETGDTTDDPNVSGNDIYDIASFAGPACKNFCDIIAANGYYPMVYSFTWYFKNTIGLSNVKDYDLWLASWPKGSDGTTQIYQDTTPAQAGSVDHSKRDSLSPYDSNVTMWQYTGSGACDGIYYGDGGSANVDLNVCYVDYPSIIKKGGYNGFSNIEATVATLDDGRTYCYWGGSKLPDSNNNFQNPNVMVTGLNGSTGNYKGLENYGTNKDKIFINGRSLAMWENHPDGPVINNIWIYSDGDGKSYMGIDIANTSILRIKDREGTGEEIESIVIGRGFEIVSTTSDRWTAGEISADDANIGSVVGVFKENVILTAYDNLKFNVTLGGSNSLGLSGYTFETETKKMVKITAGVNIRLKPQVSATAIAFGNPGDTYEYLGEIRDSGWLMVECKGHVAWVSSSAASLVNVPRYVNLTNDSQIRSGPDTTYDSLGIGYEGDRFEYLEETQNTKWLKVNYNGQDAWISNVNATLEAAPTIVNVIAENKAWDVPLEVTVSTINGAQIRTSGVQGLRFISSIEKGVDFDHVVEYGTILIPSEDITDISELVIGATLNGHKVAKVPANYIYSETDDAVTFTAVLTNIANKNLKREYTARAYAILDNGTVVYADTGASRSVYSVAKAGLEAGRESEEVLDIFRNIIKTADRFGDNDLAWPWN